MQIRPILMALCLSVAMLGASATLNSSRAQAGTATSSIVVSATVLSFCIVVATPIAFGNYTQAVLNATGSVTATCTLGTTYTIALNAGTGTGAVVANRLMTGPTAGSYLAYSLFKDNAYANVWGTTGSQTVAGIGTGLPVAVTVYGQVFANQLVATGLYGDTVTATLSY